MSTMKYLIAGKFDIFDGNSRNKIIVLNSDGTENTEFYDNLGTAFSDPNFLNVAYDSGIQSNGKILIGGGFTEFNNNSRRHLIRLFPDGIEDIDFYLIIKIVF